MGPAIGGATLAPALPQLGYANVTATATTYEFAGAGIGITLSECSDLKGIRTRCPFGPSQRMVRYTASVLCLGRSLSRDQATMDLPSMCG